VFCDRFLQQEFLSWVPIEENLSVKTFAPKVYETSVEMQSRNYEDIVGVVFQSLSSLMVSVVG
jgi:hypothetical protein